MAKIAPAHSNSAICLGREVIIANQLSALPEGTRIALSIVEALTIPKSAGDCEVVVYLNPGVNALGRYFPNGSINDLLLPWHAVSRSGSGYGPPNEQLSAKRKRERARRNLYGLNIAEDFDGETNGYEDGEAEAEIDADMGPPAGGEVDVSMDLDTPVSFAFLSSTTLPGIRTATDVSKTLISTDASNKPLPSLPPESLDANELPSLPPVPEPNEAWDVMDLASFLEFSIASTHCLEILHKSGHKHREVRANAFHVNVNSGVVRFAHFGNRSESLETTGGPSALVLRASGLLGPGGSSTKDLTTDSAEEEWERMTDVSDLKEFEIQDTRKVKEAICYLAPEQTGTAETNNEDHRTDLYALGILFWTLLVGHGTLPFEGSPVELLHKVVQVRPREVHEIRRDIPPVLGAIIAKLLSKNPDARYNSAVGLKNDLMECQKRLTLSCATAEGSNAAGSLADIDFIPSFELGQHDMFLELTIPGDLFGREKQVEEIRSTIKTFVANAAAHVHSPEGNTILAHKPSHLQMEHPNASLVRSDPSTASLASAGLSNASVGYSNASFGMAADPALQTDVSRVHQDEEMAATARAEGFSSTVDLSRDYSSPTRAMAPGPGLPPVPSLSSHRASIPNYSHAGVGTSTGASAPSLGHNANSHSLSMGSSVLSGASLRGTRTAQAQSIVICGPAGIGKSTLVQMHQATWRKRGLWGHAKMIKGEASPFTGLLTCLSSVLRQLMMFQSDRHMFVSLLRARLGPQLHNVPLLYHGVPELRDLLAAFGINLAEPQALLSTEELGARFQSLVECVYGTLADVRILALFLDDLHFADKSMLDLIGLLADSKSRILILTTCRNDDISVINHVHHVFSSKARTKWINLEPLDQHALGKLVSTTLQRSEEDIAPLTRLVSRVSMGNPFQARNLLQTVWRQGHIWYEWGVNMWQYNLEAIEQSVHAQQLVSAPTDISFLVAHFKDLSQEAQRYLIWASLFGPTFKTNDVANMMDSELEDREGGVSIAKGTSHESNSELESDIDDIVVPGAGYSRASMRGLQQVLAQGWLIQRARDMCSFTHDKYRQAATHMASQLPDIILMQMSLQIASHLMQEPERDVFRITEYCRRCIPLIREHPRREDFIDCLVQAAESSAARGAHELALQAFKDARTLLGEGSWRDFHDRSQELALKLAELYGSQGNHDSSDQLIAETLLHARKAEDRAHALRLRGRNRFVQKDFDGAYNDTVQALKALDVQIPVKISPRELDDMFDKVKSKLLSIGFDEMLHLPRTPNTRTDLIVSIMSDGSTGAFWGANPSMAGYMGLTVTNLALSEGISPGTAVGLFWFLGAIAEKRQMYRFCSDLGKLALQLAYKFGNSIDKCRSETLYSAMASGYAPEHIRTVIERSEAAIALARSAGDRIYEGLAQCYSLAYRLYCSEHLSDLVNLAEEIVADIRVWTVNSDTNALAMAILMTARALAGEAHSRSADTAFDTDKWKEAHFLHKLHESSGNFDLVMNWYNSFKIAGLYSLGFHSRAAELGFDIYTTRTTLPSHRHIRYGLFFHSLAMIQCIRHGSIPQSQQLKYLQQTEVNQQYLRSWVSPSPINNSAWHALIDAELASLQENPEAFKLYDTAVKLAVNHDWAMEEAWALYLEGSHFLRCGVEGLGSELQARGIARHRQWGAYGIVNHLTRNLVPSATPLKRNIFSAEAGVQTDETQDNEVVGPEATEEPSMRHRVKTEDNEASMLTAANLADVLKWSQSISSDINLTSSLQRLTEIATEHSQAQDASFALRTDEGEYNIVTSCSPSQPCIVFEQPKSVRRVGDPLKRAVLQHCLNSRTRIFLPDTSTEPRFAQEAGQSVIRSVICIPFSNNRGQTYGALYLGSPTAFTETNVAILSLLSQQASISIANAMLFRSVQQATKANLQMIHSQRQALEEARSSREDAMKATKIKSNFLASMSHELRTPFSSFYGLLDILGSTSLDSNQRELVQTAKQSCELLLKIIDSILDYSKLEASALKLEPLPFLVEDVVADCVELLLPLAAQKLDLSYDISPEVPLWALGDYSRIRQILMNLLGNALKFTEKGSVSTSCYVDDSIPCGEDEVVLKWVIQDTGIGMSEADMKNLWQPFSQADNSSTRRFGGTGLGLSISLSLVKLMGGDIGVTSEPNVGSQFWFHIPVRFHVSDETKKYEENVKHLRQKLLAPRPLRILISSPSSVTLSLLSTLLSGFNLAVVNSPESTIVKLTETASTNTALDFLILDHFGHSQLQEVAVLLDNHSAFSKTKAIHLYTPTPLTAPSANGMFAKPNITRAASVMEGNIDMALASATGFASTQKQIGGSPITSFGRIVRMNKPPRRARLLQLLANLKDISVPAGGLTGSQIERALESLEAAQTLFNTANVLIAEDNPVANKLLVKQLHKYDISVVATVDGSEAVKEWESHPPGFFNFALFDHHMPICDGVDAAKRIRALEMRRKAKSLLPIIALSADCQESTKELCLSAGMTGFLTKPVRSGDLPNLLKTYGTPRVAPAQ